MTTINSQSTLPSLLYWTGFADLLPHLGWPSTLRLHDDDDDSHVASIHVILFSQNALDTGVGLLGPDIFGKSSTELWWARWILELLHRIPKAFFSQDDSSGGYVITRATRR